MEKKFAIVYLTQSNNLTIESAAEGDADTTMGSDAEKSTWYRARKYAEHTIKRAGFIILIMSRLKWQVGNFIF